MPKIVWSLNDEDFIYDNLKELVEYYDDPDTDLEVGTQVYYAEESPVLPSDLFNYDSTISLMEIMDSNLYELGGEGADLPPIDEAAKEELIILMQNWIEKHCKVNWNVWKNSKPYELTAEDLKDYKPINKG